MRLKSFRICSEVFGLGCSIFFITGGRSWGSGGGRCASRITITSTIRKRSTSTSTSRSKRHGGTHHRRPLSHNLPLLAHCDPADALIVAAWLAPVIPMAPKGVEAAPRRTWNPAPSGDGAGAGVLVIPPSDNGWTCVLTCTPAVVPMVCMDGDRPRPAGVAAYGPFRASPRMPSPSPPAPSRWSKVILA